MIDFTEIDSQGETWELFARDFLSELGFYIVSQPDRGPDGKKDLIVSEDLKGNLGKYKFKWLVSCKHFAMSNKSVTEDSEINIRERVEHYNCDGFIGFYSTITSSGLNQRLSGLKDVDKIKDYRVFDSKLIENYLITSGYSNLLMRYFPKSFVNIKPIQAISNEYFPLRCRYCEKDILVEMFKSKKQFNIIWATDYNEGVRYFYELAVVCSGECDHVVQSALERRYNCITAWQSINDLTIPLSYIRYIQLTYDELYSGRRKYSALMLKQEKEFIFLLGQKVVRQTTEDERQRLSTLQEFGLL